MIPTTDINALQEAIKSSLETEFTGMTIAYYDRPGEIIPTPSILFEIDDMVSDDPDEIGTEQMAITINFNAYVVLDYKTGNKKAVKALAGAILAFVRGKRWGQAVGAAKTFGAFPDRIRGKERDYEVMRVEFSHEALLGEDFWKDEDGVLPWQVYLGISPLIGPDNVEFYEKIYEGDEPPTP